MVRFKTLLKYYACILLFATLPFLLYPTKKSSPSLSILICTIEDREDQFNHIFNKLLKQIKTFHLQHEIEILSFKDKRGEHSIGYKRNVLLQKSTGTYICFVDDDDDVSPHYVKLIYDNIIRHKPDCLSLTGIITENGHNPRTFIHSIDYTTYFQKNGVYYRPPNHLNPIKRSIAIQFQFPDTSHGEDTAWAYAIAQSKLLKRESKITEPYYFYLFKSNK
jgi:Glycosyl transferase family 2